MSQFVNTWAKHFAKKYSKALLIRARHELFGVVYDLRDRRIRTMLERAYIAGINKGVELGAHDEQCRSTGETPELPSKK